MSKLANPWKCDASNCGMLRANDTNHWLVIWNDGIFRRDENDRYPDPPEPLICISPWNDRQAEEEGTKHACGIDCALKITAQLIVENFFPKDAAPAVPQDHPGSARKEVADGKP